LGRFHHTIQEELNSLEQMGTWDVVDRIEVPRYAKILPSKLYEVSCSADPMADPKYHSKIGESFALTAAAQKSFIYEGFFL
jgi:hypothetical protein